MTYTVGAVCACVIINLVQYIVRGVIRFPRGPFWGAEVIKRTANKRRFWSLQLTRQQPLCQMMASALSSVVIIINYFNTRDKKL